MNGLGLFGATVVGLLAGWIANRLLNRRHSLLACIVVGLLGAVIGMAIVDGLEIQLVPGFFSTLIVSSVGAILLLSVLSLVRRKR